MCKTLELMSVAATLVMASPAPAASEFPYRAYVNREDVYVRSGPGDEYYPTDKLKIGAEVQVYRHDPGGWHAVRPPIGSFAWVSARYLDMKRDRLATVNAERVSARVGSRFSDIRDVVQVRLNKGELVEVLDSMDGTDEQGAKTVWHKIAPPAGEFRWIHSKYLDLERPHDGVSRPRTAAKSSAAEPGAPDAEPRRFAGDAQPMPNSPAAQPPVQPAKAEVPLGIPPAMRALSPQEYQAELDDVDLKLSLMVAEEVTAWSFDVLRPRAEKLVETAQTAVERGRAKSLSGKIARFEEIRKRYDTAHAVSVQTEVRNRDLAQRARLKAESAPPVRASDRFDGMGRLSRVASQTNGSPRFALLEPNGRVRCYVSPAPGVSLQGYVGRDVGVNGIRGFIPDQQAHHVMVKHVTLLDEEPKKGDNF